MSWRTVDAQQFLRSQRELTQNWGVTQSHLGYYTLEDSHQISKHDELN